MAKVRESGSNAIWERDILMIFCELCLKEVAAGNRPTTHFNKEGWMNIVKNFEAKTGRGYERTQLKNKWDQLKKDWKIWKELKRGSTGLGWDPKKKTVDPSDDWWSEKLKIQPSAKKFRFSGIDPELEENLNQMFGGAVTTGEHAWTASQDVHNLGEHEIATQKESSNDLIHDPTQIIDDLDESSYSKCPTSLGVKVGIKKKKGATFLREQISQLVSACTSMHVEKNIKQMQPSLSEAIKVLEQIEEVFKDIPFYLFATQLLEDANKREIFLIMSPERRVQYLHFYFEKNNM